MERNNWLLIIGLAAFAALTQLLVWYVRPKKDADPFVGAPRSDYTLQNFTMNALDDQGHLSFILEAPRLARRSDDGMIFVDLPHYTMVDSGGNLWKGTSDAAWTNKDGTELMLSGAVEMHRLPNDKVQAAQIVTTDMMTWPKDKRMQTATLATITQPDSVSSGVGMKSDLNLKVVEFLSSYHGSMLPSK